MHSGSCLGSEGTKKVFSFIALLVLTQQWALWKQGAHVSELKTTQLPNSSSLARQKPASSSTRKGNGLNFYLVTAKNGQEFLVQHIFMATQQAQNVLLWLLFREKSWRAIVGFNKHLRKVKRLFLIIWMFKFSKGRLIYFSIRNNLCILNTTHFHGYTASTERSFATCFGKIMGSNCL